MADGKRSSSGSSDKSRGAGKTTGKVGLEDLRINEGAKAGFSRGHKDETNSTGPKRTPDKTDEA